MQERKVCLITGGGKALLKDGKPGAIGYGIAHVFAAEGYNLVITGRNVKSWNLRRKNWSLCMGSRYCLCREMSPQETTTRKPSGLSLSQPSAGLAVWMC